VGLRPLTPEVWEQRQGRCKARAEGLGKEPYIVLSRGGATAGA
jgi:hypothetical protein